uniref:Uncharacterized protein n=1 Tax=Cacopsylla melanoneura TaxID=428564 RepID=A0A8D9FIT7_9HEMI
MHHSISEYKISLSFEQQHLTKYNFGKKIHLAFYMITCNGYIFCLFHISSPYLSFQQPLKLFIFLRWSTEDLPLWIDLYCKIKFTDKFLKTLTGVTGSSLERLTHGLHVT